MLDLENLRASLWAILYSLLIVLVCGSLIGAGVSHVIVVPIGLFALPLLATVPFLVWRKQGGE